MRISDWSSDVCSSDLDSELAPALTALADDLASRKSALVHGDVSPKNILVSASGPVFLDAECAVYGDPAFDLAFCTTHLLLKSVWSGDRKSTRLKLQSLMRISYAVFCLKKKKSKSDTESYVSKPLRR